MANTDGYRSPVDFRITRNPAPIIDDATQNNFNDLYDFAFAVITTFVKYCGIGTIDSSSWATIRPKDSLFSGNVNKIYVPCKNNITSGLLISLVLDAGVLKADMAAGAAGSVKQADGFATGTYLAGAIGEFILQSGLNTFRTVAFTLGQRYWLGLAGNYVTAPLVAAGQLEQYAGIAVATDSLLVNLGPAIQH